MHIKRIIAWTVGSLPFLPAFAFAQAGLDLYIVRFGDFLNKFVVPLLLALAFVFFVYNAVRFFVIGGASSESQQKAKTLAIWGVLAFVFIVSIWGLTNMVVSALGISNNTQFCPDYNPNCK
jgi:succinate dehydrogenase/fumarate reductase cytochrome b subunit